MGTLYTLRLSPLAGVVEVGEVGEVGRPPLPEEAGVEGEAVHWFDLK